MEYLELHLRMAKITIILRCRISLDFLASKVI